MSWSDAFTAEDNLFRRTSTGLRVFAMVPVVGRLAVVSDADALRVQNDVRRGMGVLFVLVPVLSRLLKPWGWGAGLVGSLAIAVAVRYWLARGLPMLSRRDVTLTPRRRRP